MLELKIWNPEDTKIIPAILQSASIAHKQPINSFEWFNWKFKNSPFGNAIIAYAQTNDGVIAGAVAFGMYELSKNDKVIKAALSYETFVHPSFQKRGLFTQLTTLAIEEAKKRQVEILFNFPNTSSLPGFIKMGWHSSKCIKFYVRPASFLGIIFKLNPKALKKTFIADKINHLPEDSYQVLTSPMLKNVKTKVQDKIIANRTIDYLIWRYKSFPLHNYKLISTSEGSSIVRTGKRGDYSEVQIMEVFPQYILNRKFYSSIIKQIKKELKPDLISTNVSTAHPATKILSSLFFISLPNKINFTVLPLQKDRFDMVDGSDWIITGTEFHTY